MLNRQQLFNEQTEQKKYSNEKKTKKLFIFKQMFS